jgi:renal tumor antigen
MTDGYYDHKMDIWGAGCVMFEILTLVPLFPGNNEMDMIHRIHNIVGTPHPKVFERFKKYPSLIYLISITNIK